MPQVKFKYQDEALVYPNLVQAVNALCTAKGKDALCTSGYRSLEKQKVINKQVASVPGRTQRPDGSVYDKAGKCWAAAYGKSNHNYCIAMDIDGEWFKKLTNSDLYKYGLFKPMSHEPWHIQLLEHSNLTQAQKEAIRESVLNPKPVDELKEALEFICPRADISFDTWYRIAKTVKWLDVAFIKIYKAWRGSK